MMVEAAKGKTRDELVKAFAFADDEATWFGTPPPVDIMRQALATDQINP